MVVDVGVEFLARTPWCQGKRHVCEGVSERQGPRQAGSDAKRQCSLLRGHHYQIDVGIRLCKWASVPGAL